MKTFGKSFLIGALLTLAGTQVCLADGGFIEKIKSFFAKKPVQTEAFRRASAS